MSGIPMQISGDDMWRATNRNERQFNLIRSTLAQWRGHSLGLEWAGAPLASPASGLLVEIQYSAELTPYGMTLAWVASPWGAIVRRYLERPDGKAFSRSEIFEMALADLVDGGLVTLLGPPLNPTHCVVNAPVPWDEIRRWIAETRFSCDLVESFIRPISSSPEPTGSIT